MVGNNNTSALSRDIRLLGDMLGTIIREQQGDHALALVEQVRMAAKARRSGDDDAAAVLTNLISTLTLEEKHVLIKAFANYFQLINIAEDLQRVRTLHEREAQNTLEETVDEAIKTLHANGYTGEDVRNLLERVRVRLVLTAHPSEAKRQEVLIKLRDIFEYMETRERKLHILPREEKRLLDDIMRRVEQLWQTRPNRTTRATVEDEVDFGVYFITSIIMDVVAEQYIELRESLYRYYPNDDWSRLPSVLLFASWIGGDRDGNPNVTPEVTLHTLSKLRRFALRVYRKEIDYIGERLTQADNETGFSDELQAHIADMPENPRYKDERYRQFVYTIREKLTRDAYATTKDLLTDLEVLYRSLHENRAPHSADGTLYRLIIKVKLFGLHLVPLDVREDARLLTTALTEIFARYKICEDYASLPESEKQALLTREIQSLRPLFPLDPNFSEGTNRVINTWRMIAQAHKQYGTIVIDSFIGSMSQEASDVLAMLLFAQEAGISEQIDLVPLFETVDDLKRAPAVMDTLFQNDAYRQHLATRQNNQQIMIGYSDSNKDSGYIASNWNLYQAQAALTEVCIQHQVTLELFHGRGGSIGRGGGPTNRAILAQPPHSMQGHIKITEQGEVIAYRYSTTEIARRHLHQVMNAAFLATAEQNTNTMLPEWGEAMKILSEISHQAYRTFVYETPGFLTYWQQATPIDELSNMQIGSRPAKRRTMGGFDSIRAIPWVFSWMQSRAIIPSWYGVGWALETFCKENPDGLTLLHTMYQQWAFFRALIENVQLDVAKADMGIAALYTTLVDDAALSERIFDQMRTEHARANEYISQIVQQKHILDKMPVMQRSIERRNPYVDPLNFIQVDLLRELRKMNPESPQYAQTLQAVLSTINGIAAGMKTTG